MSEMATGYRQFQGAKFCALCRKLFPIDGTLTRCPADATVLSVIRSSPFEGSPAGRHYQIVELLGCGGWSLVFKAYQRSSGNPVAVKMLHAHMLTRPDTAERFNREAAVVSRLNHPNIIGTVDYGLVADGIPYIVMEYIAGENLDELLLRTGRLSVEDTYRMLRQACDGVSAAHAISIIHRDIKPSNLRITNFGSEALCVKVMDFGLAKIGEESGLTAEKLTLTGFTLGTPSYMSPELCRGKTVDQRSDVYSLGCVMYEMLAGRPPFIGSNAFETMQLHTSQKVTPLQSQGVKISSAVEAVVMKALAKDPQDRFASVDEFKNALDNSLTPVPEGITHHLASVFRNIGKTFTRDDNAGAASDAGAESGKTTGTQVLVIESDEAERNLLVIKLKLLGINACAAGTAREALDALATASWAMVLVDPFAPGVEHMQLLSRLRKLHPQQRRVPVVAILDNARRGDLASETVDECIYKPLSIADLRSTLRRWLLPHQPAAQTGDVEVADEQLSDWRCPEEETLALLDDLEETIVPHSTAEETQPLHAADQDPINIRLLLDTYGTDMTRELLTVFTSTAERLLALLEDACHNERMTAVQLLAHQLKGASSAIGAVEITRLSDSMENAAANRDGMRIRIIREGLKWSVARLVCFVRQQVPSN